MSTPDAALTDLERRAWRYDAQDGIAEVLAGFLFLIVARSVVDPRLAWMLALSVFPLHFARKILKERYSYPRVGYVKLRSEEGAELGRGMLTYVLGLLAIFIVGIWLLGDITNPAQWKRWLPALAGGYSAGGFIYLAQKAGFVRHWVLAAVSVGWGVACAAWLNPPGILGMQRWAVGFGMVCLVVGTVTFFNFLRTHPVRAAGEPNEPA